MSQLAKILVPLAALLLFSATASLCAQQPDPYHWTVDQPGQAHPAGSTQDRYSGSASLGNVGAQGVVPALPQVPAGYASVPQTNPMALQQQGREFGPPAADRRSDMTADSAARSTQRRAPPVGLEWLRPRRPAPATYTGSYGAPAHQPAGSPPPALIDPAARAAAPTYSVSAASDDSAKDDGASKGAKNEKADADKDEAAKGVAPITDSRGCDGCLPSWLFSAEFLSLRRSKADEFPLLTDEISGAPRLVTSRLGPDQGLGYRLGFTKLFDHGLGCGHWGCGSCGWSNWGLECNYLGGLHWSGGASESGGLALNGPGFLLGLTPSQWRVRYESDLQGIELHLKSFDCEPFRWYVGYRWLNLHDNLLVDELISPIPRALRVAAENNYHGFQVGADVELFDCCGNFRIDGTVKGGLYHNSGSARLASSVLGPPLRVRSNDLSFVGEARLSLTYQVNCRLAVRGGYHVMGIGDVVLAPDQILSNDISTGWGRLNHNSLFLDGAHLGLEYTW